VADIAITKSTLTSGVFSILVDCNMHKYGVIVVVGAIVVIVVAAAADDDDADVVIVVVKYMMT